jgi:hypothetical protein
MAAQQRQSRFAGAYCAKIVHKKIRYEHLCPACQCELRGLKQTL